VPGLGRSAAFKIGNDSYHDALSTTMLGLYGLRCGTAISFDYQGQHFGHAACTWDDGTWTSWASPAPSAMARAAGTTRATTTNTQ